MTRWLALVMAACALGCGARTDLDRGEPVVRQPDSGPDVFVFDGFPCRWSLGSAVEIARGRSIDALTGAVHPVRDQVVVMATRDGERVGGRIALSIRPELVAPLTGFEGEVFSGAEDWLRQLGGACALMEHDETFAPGAAFTFGPESGRCALGQSEIGRVESVPLGFDSGSSASLTYPGPMLEAVAPIAGTARAVMVRAVDRGALVALEDESGSLLLARILPSGATERATIAPAVLASAALDRIWQRAMLLYFVEASGWQLAHVGWDGPLEITPHADIRMMPRPAGRLRSNETEALIPLSDGTMAFFPLPMSRVRFTDPVEEDRRVEAMEIILRPGGSAGGLLYVHREPSGEAVLIFRALVCNR